MPHDSLAVSIQSPNGQISAVFLPERGGILSSLKLAGREYLYQHDFFTASRWHDLPGAWPFCFPVCARLAYRGEQGVYLHDGKPYKMPIHGVAWWQAWTVIESSAYALTLELTDTDASRAMYPFAFSVRLQYECTNEKLLCRQYYENRSAEVMPYYAGFHPYFYVPMAEKSQTFLSYTPVKRYVYNADYTQVIGEQPLFSLPCAVSDPILNEQLTKIVPGSPVSLTYADGRCLTLCASGVTDADLFSYVQLYTQADKPFFCIEPWMGAPNSLNDGGTQQLAPGEVSEALLTLGVC